MRWAQTLAVAAAVFVPTVTTADPATRLAVADAAVLFPLADVRLIGGPLGDQQQANRRYLLKLDPDRLLSSFRREAGLDPKGPPYRGWESERPLLPGHILGFYMSGAAMTVAATGDDELRRRLAYVVDQLAEVQRANGSGYMLAVPDGRRVFADIAAGHIDVGGLPWTGYQINGQFEPTYTLNKLMLGLYAVHVEAGVGRARDVLVRLADWFGRDVLDRLDDAQVQRLLDCEHGSLNESFADVYALTGDGKYLHWARRLCHERMLAPLARGDGAFLTRYHANTQIPKFTGFERVYTCTGEAALDAAAVHFWDEVVGHRTWAIGGNSADEHFFAPDAFGSAVHAVAGPESCNSVNMLRLTEALYRAHPSGRRIDYAERVLLNHLLAAHDPLRCVSCYYTSMRPGAYRVYGDEFDSMWCCVGTGLEVPGDYGRLVYSHAPDDAAVTVNLFAPSELTWAARGVRLRQTTDFPREPGTTLTVTCNRPAEFAIRIRRPAWVDGLRLAVNGTPIDGGRGDYAEVRRAWHTGDVVHVELPMRLHVEPLPGDDRYVALLYGPVVLSGALGRGDLAMGDFWGLHDATMTKVKPESAVPMLPGDAPADVLRGVEPVPGRPLTFRTAGGVDLIPFYENHFQRYAIYWRRQTTADRARAADEAARTVDVVTIGDAASEAAHHLAGERTNTGSANGGRWRDARDGGWFAYVLRTTPAGRPGVVRCTYWGREFGPRTFEVQVDGHPIGTTTLADTGTDDFRTVDLPVPADLMAGRSTVTVRFQARPGNSAGGLFGVRLLSAAD